MIIAGAGSGKTRALTHRVAYLIGEKRIDPRNILAVTFTNKAAKEMKERISKILSNRFALPAVGTFHAICVRILRLEAEKVGFGRNFLIYDTKDQVSVVKQTMNEMGLNQKQFNPMTVLGTISGAKNELIKTEAYKERAVEYYEEIVAQIYLKYQEKLKKNNALDFDDLIFKTVDLFEMNAETLKKYQERWRYVMVDEYQDTNIAQYRLINLISQKYQNLCTVGDDWQCLVEGTKIKTLKGLRRIEEIKPGELILAAAGEEKTGTFKVLGVNRKEKREEIFIIRTESGKTLKCTKDHVIFIKSQKEPSSRRMDIFKTDLIEIREKGQIFKFQSIKEAEDFLNNREIEKGFYLTWERFEFLRVRDIKAGMECAVLENNRIKKERIRKIEKERYEGEVYDLNIEKAHNFIAEGIVVHNSIYGWRGANIQNILNFEKDYPRAKVVLLEQNYRSTKNILEAANAVIRQNINRKEKKLWTENEAGEKISVLEAENEQDEANFVVDIISEERQKGVALDNFAILYRTNAQSRSIEEAFLKRGVPYKIVGGVKFYERKEIKDVLAYLSFLINEKDWIHLERIFKTGMWGIGSVTFEKTRRFLEERNLNLRDGLAELQKSALLKQGALARFKAFIELFEEFEKQLKKLTLVEFLDYMLERLNFFEFLKKEGEEEGEERWENVRELFTVIQRFENLNDFLEEIALIQETDNLSSQQEVVLMTLHSAKGLEFSNVFIVGMEEGIFPHSKSVLEPSEMEEERRLCYVGITRAKKKLHLIHARSRNLYGNFQANTPSRFLEEIPDKFLEDLNGRKKGEIRKERNVNLDFPDGTPVEHEQFGRGVVISTQDEILTVAFKRFGVKKLSAKVAPLKKV